MNLSFKGRFHLWIPALSSNNGGIQRYSSFLLQTLLTLEPELNYDIFLKHDIQTPSDISYRPNLHFHWAGIYPPNLRTLAFATQIFSRGMWQSPNLVISTHLNFTILAYWLKRLRGIPYWTIAHGIEAWNIQNLALQNALQAADRILCVSGYTRDRLLTEQNLDPNKICVLPNTFDPNRFQPAPKPNYLLLRYGLQQQQPVILTVARLSEAEQYKGYDQILRAMPQIRQIIPDVHYMIVGKGNDKNRIEQMITKLGLQNCVTLAGFVPEEQLCDYYNLCDVFAMPSKGEGFGIVYLEALGCGKPVLGGNQDGAIDALCHGEMGVLVNPSDVESIAQALIQILQGTDPNRLLYRPESLRQKVIDTFGFEQFQRTLEKYLEQHFQLI
ncbi:MAG: glycosyltransferase [Aulosira sp. DedQUE10]|nr:glycosyltransferase [Aulosira sp. DedQUE10]